MFISHKSNVLQQVHETEWQCRRFTKGLEKPEYWEWLATITSGDPPVVDYSGETGYTIVECTDEDVQARLVQLDDYIADSYIGNTRDTEIIYNIKYYASKRDAEEILDNDGNSHDPKQYVSSHFVGQDDTKDARLLADEWVLIRRERTRLLADTDHLALSDQTLTEGMTTHRQKLRDIPTAQGSATKYSDITWPTKP